MLVVGVIIGVAVMVNGGDEASKKFGPHNNSMSSMKRVTSICELTQYKGSCAKSLEPAAKNVTSTSKDYILAVLLATLHQGNTSSYAITKLPIDKSKDPYNYAALLQCKEFLDLSVDTLRAAVAVVSDRPNPNALDPDDVHQLLSWTTAVYSLHTTCLDQFDGAEPRQAAFEAIINSTELSHNSVNVIAELPQILKLFDDGAAVKKLANSVRHPRSLIAHDDDNDDDDDDGNTSNNNIVGSEEVVGGYPAWIKAEDRMLLAELQIKADVVVASDGSGQFNTIGEAIAAYPVNPQKGRFVIHVKAGVYNEQVLIDRRKPHIFMYGDGIGKTIVSGNKNGKMKVGTTSTATFANEGTGFIARGMTFRNKAGPQGNEGVAFRSIGDKTALFDCSVEGYQNTLYYQAFRQFYRNCIIYGTIDTIFGKGEAVIQDSEIIVRKPMQAQINTVTADGKEILKGSNGLVLQNCRIIPEKALFPTRFEIPTYLGRPSTPEALTVVMQSELGDFIRPEGWTVFGDGIHNHNHKRCRMYEYANRGPGAKTQLRNKNFVHYKVLKAEEAAKYSPGQFLGGARWLPKTGVPFRLGL